MDLQWFYYSAEWVPALFIMLFSIMFDMWPFRLTRRALEGVCDAPQDACVGIIKQKTLLEFGALSFILAIIREILQGHNYMAFFGFLGLAVFLGVGYFWLTFYRTRRFSWVSRPVSCCQYVFSLIAMSSMISIFGGIIEGQASILAGFLQNRPLLLFVGLALAMFVIILVGQVRKGESEPTP